MQIEIGIKNPYTCLKAWGAKTVASTANQENGDEKNESRNDWR